MSKHHHHKRAAARAVAPVAPPKASVYESGSQVPRTTGWRAPTTYPNQNVIEYQILRDRSRKAVRDDGTAGGMVRSLVTNIVGTGITPLSKADDRGFRKQVQALWDRWTEQADADGNLDWYGLEQLIVREWLEAGEIFVRLRPRRPGDRDVRGRLLAVPLQVQVIEPELCPYRYVAIGQNGNRVRAGVEFDLIGRRTAYYFYAARPGDWNDVQAGEILRTPASSIIHMFKPLRAGQIRGIPAAQAALVRLWDLDQFDDATLVRQKLANMFVAFLKNMPTASSAVDALTGNDTQQLVDSDKPTLRLEPGLFQELAPGEEVDWSEPPDVIASYNDYVVHHLRAAGTAAGVPYEVFTGDWSKVNDRTARIILHEFRRSIEAEQQHTVAHQLCDRVWLAFLDAAYLAGALPLPAAYLDDPEPWAKVSWMPQSWKYIHPVQDVQAEKEAIRCGLKSRRASVAESGEDVEEVDAEQADDNARADQLKLKFDSDGRNPASGGGGGAAGAAGGKGMGGDAGDDDGDEGAGKGKQGASQEGDE